MSVADCGYNFRILGSIVRGLRVTVLVAVLTIIGSAIGAVILGTLSLSTSWLTSLLTTVFIELIRGPSALILLFWVHYALPMILGIPKMGAFTSAVLVLSLVGSVYGAEIVRAGIGSIPKGQRESCYALGISRWNTMFRVILPQALSQIIPAFGSMARDMVKWTSIVSFVGVQDMLYAANSVRSETFETTKVFCLLAVAYYILTVVCGLFFRAIEWVLPLNRALRTAEYAKRELIPAVAVGAAK